MDKEATFKGSKNEGQQHDWDTWCPGVSYHNSPLNPILFE